MLYKITRDELSSECARTYSAAPIAGAHYAVIANTTTSRGIHPVSVLSTHRSYDAACAVLRRASRSAGRIYLYEVLN